MHQLLQWFTKSVSHTSGSSPDFLGILQVKTLLNESKALFAVLKVVDILSCLTLCDPVDCSLLGFSVHGDSPGKNTGVGSHSLLPGIFSTQGLNPGLLHCR